MRNKVLIIIVCVSIIIGIIGIIGLIAMVVAAIKRQEAQAAKETAQRQERYRKWLAEFKQNGCKLSPVKLPILMKDGEEGFYQSSAQMFEPRSVRTARHGGMSVRVARGVTIGQGGTRSESHEEWRQIADGYFYITSHRIVFDGDKQSRNIKLSDIISVNYDDDCIQVSTSKRQKTMIFSSINGYIAWAILRVLTCQNRT